MAPIPKDEPVDREDDSGSEDFGGDDLVYVNDLTDGSDDDEVEGQLENHGGYTMLSQESNGAASEAAEYELAATSSESAVTSSDSNVDQMLHALDAQDQLHFPSYSGMSGDCTGAEERPASPSIWAPTPVREVHTSPEQAATIMAAMKNFSLPAHNFPAWATAVPEDVWKEQLFARIRRGTPEGSAILDPATKAAAPSDSSTSAS